MDLDLSPEESELRDNESELRDNVRSVLARVCPPTTVRAVFEGKGDAASIWERMVELYWPALAIAEEHGGLGMGFVEVALVAELTAGGTISAGSSEIQRNIIAEKVLGLPR